MYIVQHTQHILFFCINFILDVYIFSLDPENICAVVVAIAVACMNMSVYVYVKLATKRN